MKQLIVSVLVFLCTSAFGQFQRFSGDLLFNRYSTDDGLSQASVNAVIKDSKGFMWFGTDDGLNRFDGNQFRVYKQREDDTTSLAGNRVQALLEDSAGRIWVGNSQGLSMFDRHLERFISFGLKKTPLYACFDLVPGDSSALWIAGGPEGLLFLPQGGRSVLRFQHPELEGLNVVKLLAFGRNIFIGTVGNGLFILNPRSKQVTTVTLGDKPGLTGYSVRALATDGTTVWIGTERHGLKRFDPSTGSLSHFTAESGKLSDNKVWSLEVDDEKIWVGTDGGGATLIDTESGRSTFYRHSYYNIRSLGGNTIRCIEKDRSGDIWFGTFNGGVSCLPAFSIKFHSFRNDPADPFSLPHNSVLSFCELADGTLLIGTDGGGLTYLRDGKFYRYVFPSSIVPPRVIVTILESGKGDIWLGTYQDGLYRIGPDKKVTHFQHDPSDKTTIASNTILDLEEDEYGSLWIATERGLNRIRLYEEAVTSYRNRTEDDAAALFTPEFTQSLLIDSANTLWIGYSGKLTECYLPTEATKTHLTGIPNRQVLSLHLDRTNRNIIWFSAFGAGLARFSILDKTFELVGGDKGLSDSQIFAVQTDVKGNVWFTTNKGIVRYHPEQRTIYTFQKSFGVNTAPFKDNSGGYTSSGYLLFGGTNGFTAFWPADVSFQKSSLDVVLTGFRLLNEEVPIDNTILTTSINETASVRVPYDRAKFINFEFAVPNFLSPDMVQYQYKLDGFEDSWHTVESKTISLTNLLPGTYHLRVKAGFPSGLWGNERVLTLTIVPAWWMTWYARGALIAFFAATGYGLYVLRIYRLKKRKAELENIVREQNQELATRNRELSAHNEELLANRETISLQNKMLSDAQEQLREINISLERVVQHRTEKLNDTINQLNKTIKELDAFLYSASHDLVSPLKSILGIVNLAKIENKNPSLHGYFEHIEISVSKLEAIIQTLMQHSFNTKADVRMEPVDLRKIVEETIHELKFIPEAGKIRFNYVLKDAVIVSDAHRLKIILNNLLGNAVKYHDSRKQENIVRLDFRNSGSAWVLEIADNGIGIERDRLGRVFELFYRATESAKGSGLGLYIVKDTIDRLGGSIVVDSEIGHWTKFSMTFPMKPEYAELISKHRFQISG